MENTLFNTDELRFLILNHNEPLIFKQFLKWKILKWDLDRWNNILKSENLNFRCGKNTFTETPQWERTNTTEDMPFKDFISFTKKDDSDKWIYFDYKYLKDHFKENKELRQNISWDQFGFSELSSDDCTLWIGSRGAHTPCHMDSYGCNLVAQIYGRKQWVVFPPEENLKATRIPYEESSIYSKLNFFSPKLEDFKAVGNCRKVILEPGDVLFLPHHWWHYVENLEPAISINVWLPLPQDNEKRLEESIVQMLVLNIAKDLNEEDTKTVLNPNYDTEFENITAYNSLTLIKECIKKCKPSNKKLCTHKDTKTVNFNINDILEKHPFIETISQLSTVEWISFIKHQANRFPKDFQNKIKLNCPDPEIMDVIEAITDIGVIAVIKNNLLNH